MKQLLLQAFNLIRQNPFYATISITLIPQHYYKIFFLST